MKVLKFEGTPEEFKSIAYLFEDASTNKENVVPDASDVEANIKPQEAIRAMLRRIPVSNGQKAVYRALANGRLEYGEFLTRTGRTAQQMAGVLGALGRRISTTKEIHEARLSGSVLAVMQYENENGKAFLSLTADALEVLKAEGIV